MRIVRVSLLSAAVALAVLTIGGLPIMINYAAAATVLVTDPHDDGKGGLPVTGSPQSTEGDQSTESDNGKDDVKPETVQPSAEATQDPSSDPTSPVIYEDDPRWDCTSMGNLQCGPSAQPIEPTQPAQLAVTGVSVIELAIIGALLALAGAVAYFISLMIRHPER